MSVFGSFFIFCCLILTILASVCITWTRNGVFAILYLVLAFILCVTLLISYEVYFLSIVFVVIYVGAIAVLFLFVIMMLNVKQIEYKAQFSRLLPLNLYIMLIFVYECINVKSLFVSGRSFFYFNDLNIFFISNDYVHFWIDDFFCETLLDTDLYGISFLLYNYYGLYLLLCSLLFILGMMGAIALTLNLLVIVKKQDLYEQLERDYTVVKQKILS